MPYEERFPMAYRHTIKHEMSQEKARTVRAGAKKRIYEEGPNYAISPDLLPSMKSNTLASPSLPLALR